jgi:3-oxoacyl-[acyl-carrier-protein] synthase II
MAERRTAITGLGVVTPLGVGMDETWVGLLEGRQGVRQFDLFDPGHFKTSIAGQIEGFSARKFVPKAYRKAVKVMARDIEIAVAAADLAFLDAGIATKGTTEDEKMDVDPKRLGCNIGAGLICTELDELGQAINTAVVDGKFDFKTWGESGITNLTPLWLLKYLPNMLSCHVTIIHGAEGPSNCITCGDVSGHLAVGESALYIRRDACDVVVTGAAESKLNPMGLLRQGMLGRLCTTKNDTPADAVRPFDAGHCGTAIGEGGGLIILEDMDRAQNRGAKIYAELVGFGAACDPAGIDVERPTAGNLHMAVRSAMKSAGIGPEQVSGIVAYGTGVPGEDLAEVAEWRKALGDAAGSIPAVATTGATGTMFAGGGSVQLSIAAKALVEQTLPAMVNFEKPAEGCEMNFSNHPREMELNYLIAGAYTVGGQSGACVLKRVEA